VLLPLAVLPTCVSTALYSSVMSQLVKVISLLCVLNVPYASL
jgi:hypothetical protein